MTFLPSLSGKLQQAIEELGVPLPVSAEHGEEVYMVLELDFIPNTDGNFTARIPGIAAFGEGETKMEAFGNKKRR